MNVLILNHLTICWVLLLSYSLMQEKQIDYHDPRWSPDGEKIVFYSNKSGNFDIYVMNSDGSDMKQLTFDDSYDGMPAWSSDGKRISFASKRGGDFDIYAMNSDGSGIKELIKTENFEGTHRWSSDGNYIAFEGNNNNNNNNTDIYLFDVRTKKIKRLTTDEGNDFAPLFLNGRENIVFQSSRTGKYQIYKLNLKTEELKALTSGKSHNLIGSANRDESLLTYISYESGSPQIYIMNIDGSDKRKITNSDIEKYKAELSPDGDRIVYNEIRMNGKKREYDICIINSDGTDYQVLK